jgi:hypothetical protein
MLQLHRRLLNDPFESDKRAQRIHTLLNYILTGNELCLKQANNEAKEQGIEE